MENTPEKSRQAGKTSRYIKYAIGEIILVVIGILIALQINNWNEYNKALKNSKVYLEEMKLDLVTDTFYTTRVGDKILKEIKIAEKMLNKKMFTPSDLDSLRMGFTGSYADFYITDRTFQKLQNANESKLVGFDSLYKAISKYYTYRKTRVLKDTEYIIRESTEKTDFDKMLMQRVEFNSKQDYTDPFDDDVDENFVGDFPTINTEEHQNNVILELYNSVLGRNVLRHSYDTQIFSYYKLKACDIEAKTLLAQINSVLQD